MMNKKKAAKSIMTKKAAKGGMKSKSPMATKTKKAMPKKAMY
jgi:hypothetical protein